jgi:O-antigen/teichoic acid export membrane protein
VTPTKATVARSGAWSVASVIGSEVLFLIVFIMISRILGPRDMGVVALAGVFAELLGLLALLGIPQAVIQSSKYSELQANTAFWLVQVSGILCSLVAFFAAAPLARWFGVAEVEDVLGVLAALPFLVALGAIHEARLTRDFKFRSLTLRTLAANGVAGAVALLMAMNGFGMWSLVAQRLVLSASFSVWSWLAAGWIPGIHLSLKEARSLVAFGRHVLVGQVAWPLHLRLYDVILGHVLGPTAVGWYRLAMRCFEFLVRCLSLPLVGISLPVLSRLTAMTTAFRQALCRQFKLVGLVALPMFCFAALFAHDLLIAIFGERWQTSVALFQILCAAGIPMVFERLGWTALTAIGQPAWAARINFLLLPFMALVAWYAAHYGLTVLAWTFVFRGLLVIPLIAYLLWKVQAIEFGLWMGQMGRIVYATILVTLLAAVEQRLMIASLGLIPGMAVIAVSSVLAYVLLIRVLAPVQFREAMEVMVLIRHGRLAR